VVGDLSSIALQARDEAEDVSGIDLYCAELLEVKRNRIHSPGDLNDREAPRMTKGKLVEDIRVVEGKVGDDEAGPRDVLDDLR